MLTIVCIAYTSWNAAQAQGWLDAHGIPVPKGYSVPEMQKLIAENWSKSNAWTDEQVASVQKTYQHFPVCVFISLDRRSSILTHSIGQRLLNLGDFPPPRVLGRLRHRRAQGR
jgi:hypothetical protein